MLEVKEVNSFWPCFSFLSERVLSLAMLVSDWLGEGFPKKSSCSFGFCPNYLDPSPQFGQLVPLFLNANVPKNLGRGLPLPPHPQIDPIYIQFMKSGQKIWAGPCPPPSFGQNPKEQLLYFMKPSLRPTHIAWWENYGWHTNSQHCFIMEHCIPRHFILCVCTNCSCTMTCLVKTNRGARSFSSYSNLHCLVD